MKNQNLRLPAPTSSPSGAEGPIDAPHPASLSAGSLTIRDPHLWTDETVAAPLEDPTAITRPTIVTGHREGEWRRLVLPNPYSVHMGAGPDQALVYTDEPYPRIAVVSAEALFAAFWASADPLEAEATPDPGGVEFGSGTVLPARSDGS